MRNSTEKLVKELNEMTKAHGVAFTKRFLTQKLNEDDAQQQGGEQQQQQGGDQNQQGGDMLKEYTELYNTIDAFCKKYAGTDKKEALDNILNTCMEFGKNLKAEADKKAAEAQNAQQNTDSSTASNQQQQGGDQNQQSGDANAQSTTSTDASANAQ